MKYSQIQKSKSTQWDDVIIMISNVFIFQILYSALEII